ncbi:unnamed protein product, partial [Rotaria socialis]
TLEQPQSEQTTKETAEATEEANLTQPAEKTQQAFKARETKTAKDQPKPIKDAQPTKTSEDKQIHEPIRKQPDQGETPLEQAVQENVKAMESHKTATTAA